MVTETEWAQGRVEDGERVRDRGREGLYIRVSMHVHEEVAENRNM